MKNLLKTLVKDRRGATAIIFGLVLIPLLGLGGLALDYARAHSVRSHLAKALDAAALAAGSTSGMSESETKALIQRYFDANTEGKLPSEAGTLNIQIGDSAISLSVDGQVETGLLGVLGISHIDVGAATEVVRASKKIELALVLDNTGSMNGGGKIGALRDASASLIKILYGEKSTNPYLKVSLVPFVTAVNVKASSFKWDWIDTTGQAPYHGVNFDESGGPVNHLDLFDRIPNTEWKGCVEARAEPYDLDDSPPTNASTRWVPYFWPDEPDKGSGDYDNKYLKDSISGDQATRQAYAGKYKGDKAKIDDTPPSTKGPNKSCARPIVPLVDNKELILSEIDQMTGWYEGGTNIAQGMAWGWRVLSPGEPFTEGAAYDDSDTRKVMIVLTDGDNMMHGGWDSHNKSNYTSYGYLATNRLGTTDLGTAIDIINDKVRDICASVKEAGILLYTITFKVGSDSTKEMMKNCASSPSMYFDSPSNGELQDVFEAIGTGLSNLRISK